MSATILAVGICTPLGKSTASSQRAIVAGLNVFGETGVLDENGEPVRAAHDATLAADLDRTERVCFFAERAARECLSAIPRGQAPPIKAFVALPQAEHEVPMNPAYVFSVLKQQTSQLPMDWSEPPILGGNSGFLQAMSTAIHAITSGTASVTLVGASDSLCDEGTLRSLLRRGHLLNRDQRDGSIPGEGAGFLLLSRGPLMGLRPLGKVQDCAFAAGPAALGKVFRHLDTMNVGRTRPDHLYSAQRPVRAAGRALLEAYFRAPKLMPEPFRMTLSAESMGDTGVAAPAVEVGALLHRFTIAWRRPEPLRSALVCAHGEDGRAGAALISAP